ncbi:class III signal peptide-containing protein [Thermococcus sp. GR7]|uniref:class III signal peptide-containing protein n=1 Tax=unclassified Thermococcus TaxID=2627626 RepID=UPI001430732F|nr:MULTISPECIES: class III signal peptide-containing protein [unclassified Thermococcus]NJE45866.1 class III signal peptide-containing protein [Thermococcus sp. GR7]NJE78756.1 class III signal peptide-containing protein [Thermococcus sp. GR4]NJF22060.1 class III signal peptide-containing protein [Thermococcus sp. GR5]
MMKKAKRGQVSLEFMLIFGIMLILLLYSVNNVTFREGSTSTETLRIQVSLEEKNLANAISNTISQVYAQGPGAKSTTYVRLTYLRDAGLLEKALNLESPRIFITYGNYSNDGNGTYVTVTGTGFNLVLSGGDKNIFWSRSMYQAVLYDNPSIWSPLGSITIGADTIYGLEIDPNDLPATLKIVVEWNPDNPNSWMFDSTKGELRINIKAGR